MAKLKKTAAKKANESFNAKSLRTHRKAFVLNDAENKALEIYLKTYNIKNRSRFIRETLMTAVIKRTENNSPRLFD
jgi:hypothetical protein